MRSIITNAVTRVGVVVTRGAASLPGVAAMGCVVAGVYLLAGLAWALIAAAPFLLALDWRAS